MPHPNHTPETQIKKAATTETPIREKKIRNLNRDDDEEDNEEEELLDDVMEEEIDPNEKSIIMDNIKGAIDDDFIEQMVKMINKANHSRSKKDDSYNAQAMDGVVEQAGDMLMDRLIQADELSLGKSRSFLEFASPHHAEEGRAIKKHRKADNLNPPDLPYNFSQIDLPKRPSPPPFQSPPEQTPPQQARS
eukprot:CAMPEP_0117418226 /NCGR_PEP_ID=MMETSP0758-20121206/51_1 /TAXON_ID=63605 /ORGANISM="Percolomonas cosmopolitus, Strain AE-1 (ATCC 50343)" /LENGTH=190 /DNA_ID=CAMNT_0005198605 /DNA_START=1214 /DNA_END=1783 /DNA_ORIENTATION=+